MKEQFRLVNKLWDKIFGQIFEVESMNFVRQRQGIKYTVKRSGADEWTCDCQSFLFKSGLKDVEDIDTDKMYEETCKHIRFSMAKSGMNIKERR